MILSEHLLISWISTASILRNRRERCLVTLSGVIPDIDGLGLVIDKITETTTFYTKYHHHLGHSVFSTLFVSTLTALLAKNQKSIVWLSSFVVGNVHIFCDLIGSRGIDGYQWPIYYLYPFNTELAITWQYQWELVSWQNRTIMLALVILSAYYLATKRLTVLEVFSVKLNEAAISMYCKYFNKRRGLNE